MRYRDGDLVLKDVSFSIAAGTRAPSPHIGTLVEYV